MAGVEQQAFSLPFRNMRCIHPEVMLCVVIAVGKDGARSSAREMAKSDGLRWADGVPHLAVVRNGFYAVYSHLLLAPRIHGHRIYRVLVKKSPCQLLFRSPLYQTNIKRI